jgi:hypothetical protein
MTYRMRIGVANPAVTGLPAVLAGPAVTRHAPRAARARHLARLTGRGADQPTGRTLAREGRDIGRTQRKLLAISSPLIARAFSGRSDLRRNGAGEGNRTLVVSLGSFCSAIELHPRSNSEVAKAAPCVNRPAGRAGELLSGTCETAATGRRATRGRSCARWCWPRCAAARRRSGFPAPP